MLLVLGGVFCPWRMLVLCCGRLRVSLLLFFTLPQMEMVFLTVWILKPYFNNKANLDLQLLVQSQDETH